MKHRSEIVVCKDLRTGTTYPISVQYLYLDEDLYQPTIIAFTFAASFNKELEKCFRGEGMVKQSYSEVLGKDNYPAKYIFSDVEHYSASNMVENLPKKFCIVKGFRGIKYVAGFPIAGLFCKKNEK